MRILRSIDKMDRLGSDEVLKLLTSGRKDESGDFTEGAGLSPELADSVVFFALGSPAMAERGQKFSDASISLLEKDMHGSEVGMSGVAALKEIQRNCKALGLTDDDWTIDTSIVRGLEYYTGTVFEGSIATGMKGMNFMSFGSVGGGGRYDDLVSRFRGQPIPATGFSVGVSRLAAALAAQEEAASNGPVVVLPFAGEAMGVCMQIAAELRAAFAARGVKRGAEVYLGGSGPKAQLKYADKRGAPVAVIVGGDELRDNTVSIKNLRLGAEIAKSAEDREAWTKAREDVQVTVPREEMVARVIAIVAGD
jgi:histidyl-tRNA synthetase